MKPKLSFGKIILLALLLLAAVRFVLTRAPSEAQMIAHFHEHKAEFEQLRLMLQGDDTIAAIGPNQASAKDKQVPFNAQTTGLIPMKLTVPESRLNQYRSRLKALGLTTLDVDQLKHQIRLVQFGGGFTDTVWNVGYVWCETPPKPLVKSAYHEMPGQNKTHFTRIEGDWYIYHSR